MSIHSVDGSTWSTKLLRIGELSARDKNLVFNNLGHIISIDWLRELYRRLKGSKAIDKVRAERQRKDVEPSYDLVLSWQKTSNPKDLVDREGK